MKILPSILAAACAGLLPSCVDAYYAGGGPPRPGGPRIIEREPVRVERYPQLIDPRPQVRVDPYPDRRYPDTYRDNRPRYGDPVPGSTYRSTTTRTYEGY